MAILNKAPHFARLSLLASVSSSDSRRELLRFVTETLENNMHTDPAEIAGIDSLLAAAASQFAVQVRQEFAKLIASAGSGFSRTAEQFAFDDISIAAPVLSNSLALTDDLLVKIIREKTHDHLIAITRRRAISENVSSALVQHGNDHVVTSLLENAGAAISRETFELVAQRAQESAALQRPLIHRAGIPLDLLNDLYIAVEGELRREIVTKFGTVPPEELERAFELSRARISRVYRAVPDDFDSATRQIDALQKKGSLAPRVLVALLREGKASRTAFKIAFSRLASVEFDLVDRAIEHHDLDTIALLCRGSDFEKAIFVSFALSLSDNNGDRPQPEGLASLYESVPVLAAQRALRFWKVRSAA